MDVSPVCRSFIAQVSAMRWNDAVITFNGLNMYEMLRSLKALDATDLTNFSNALTPRRAQVDASRIDYAFAVVQTGRLLATAPAGLPPDQVAAARLFAARPYSILQKLIPKSRLPAFNVGLTAASNTVMQQILGAPRIEYSDSCQPVTNPGLSGRITSSSVGPFNATGLDSAIAGPRAVMTTVQTEQRLVYRVLGTAGMLCARLVRGSTTNISNHSWVRLSTSPLIVNSTRAETTKCSSPAIIAPIFNAQGWYWGAGFPTEDEMHFEAGAALVRGWTSAP